MSVISMQGVSKRFRGMSVLENVSFEIEEGVTYGLTGPNGSGKSVLLGLICGFLAPDAGEIRVDPRYLSDKRTFPDKFGITLNGPAYLPSRSAEQQLVELANIRKQIGIDEVRAALHTVGLNPQSKQKARTFSQGMKQKLSLAQAIMEKSEVLILDEPFNALDAASVVQIKELLREQKAAGTTIVFTSHSTSDVGELCDVVLEISGSTVHRA